MEFLPKANQESPTFNPHLYETVDPEGALEMVGLNVTLCPATGLAGLAVMETVNSAVAVSVVFTVVDDQAPSPMRLTALTCTSYDVAADSPVMV